MPQVQTNIYFALITISLLQSCLLLLKDFGGPGCCFCVSSEKTIKDILEFLTNIQAQIFQSTARIHIEDKVVVTDYFERTKSSDLKH